MNNKMIKLFLSIALSFLTTVGVSQQEAQITQYLDYTLAYNPAYAGNRDMLNISSIHRQQWVGYDGAPMTTSLLAHTPLRYDNLGVGLEVVHDKLGPVSTIWINGNLSYSIKFKKDNTKLSFGVKGGLMNMSGDLNGLIKEEEIDPAYLNGGLNLMKPNIGAGVFFSSDHFFAGFSSPRLVETSIDELSIESKSQRHFYASIGGYANLNRNVKLRPGVLAKFTDNSPMTIDGTLALIYMDKFWIGGNYRFQESAGAFVQYQFTNQFKIGYAYGFSLNEIRKASYGSHEILLSYDLLFKKNSIQSPRYF